jgi:ATP-binding cassette subfamily A (ABC1) protein 3
MIGKYDTNTDRFAASQQFGYCPQFDALLEQLTGREMLIIYSRLRGVPEEQIKSSVETIIKLTGVGIHADKPARG